MSTLPPMPRELLSWPVSKRVWGEARQSATVVIVAFHGYGQSAIVWEKFAGLLIEQYPSWRIEALDLPGHGDCPWLEEQPSKRGVPMPNSLFRQGVDDWLLESPFANGVQLHIWGFSLGARFVSEWVAARPSLWSRVVLIAPDAFGQSFWYRLATGNVLGRRWLHRFVDKPEVVWRVATWGVFMGLVSRSLLRFAQAQMRHRSHRQHLVWTWLGYSNVGLSIQQWDQVLGANPETQVEVFVGKDDTLIPWKRFEGVVHRWPQQVRFHLITANHQELLGRAAAAILPRLAVK